MGNGLNVQKQMVLPALEAASLPCLECFWATKVCFKDALQGIFAREIFRAMSVSPGRTQKIPVPPLAIHAQRVCTSQRKAQPLARHVPGGIIKTKRGVWAAKNAGLDFTALPAFPRKQYAQKVICQHNKFVYFWEVGLLGHFWGVVICCDVWRGVAHGAAFHLSTYFCTIPTVTKKTFPTYFCTNI
jgi:hypothetical protein